MSYSVVECRCGAGIVWHEGGVVCIRCGVPPWKCACQHEGLAMVVPTTKKKE